MIVRRPQPQIPTEKGAVLGRFLVSRGQQGQFLASCSRALFRVSALDRRGAPPMLRENQSKRTMARYQEPTPFTTPFLSDGVSIGVGRVGQDRSSTCRTIRKICLAPVWVEAAEPKVWAMIDAGTSAEPIVELRSRKMSIWVPQRCRSELDEQVIARGRRGFTTCAMTDSLRSQVIPFVEEEI